MSRELCRGSRGSTRSNQHRAIFYRDQRDEHLILSSDQPDLWLIYDQSTCSSVYKEGGFTEKSDSSLRGTRLHQSPEGSPICQSRRRAPTTQRPKDPPRRTLLLSPPP
ncbi:hypothetical protein L3Y34_003476 [Caenorhabditis briggsae]|uniref:Uncharacterized protein n=1 Tax=Caenorhabditis briggsae TaxID=6238 RepID=A0AAE9D3B9_CAEBR|nr:hypothetical protein L3Y34_003476 [Caenorhabditis briggsae]